MIVSLAQSYSISILDEIWIISGAIAFPFGEFTVKLLNILNMLSISTIDKLLWTF